MEATCHARPCTCVLSRRRGIALLANGFTAQPRAFAMHRRQRCAVRAASGNPQQQQASEAAAQLSRRGLLVGGMASAAAASAIPTHAAHALTPSGALLPSVATDGSDAWLRLQGQVSEFTLPNGLHFIVLERHNAPVLSCHTYANVGAFDEEDGETEDDSWPSDFSVAVCITGLAHLLEHMAFKGTARIGTRDARREAALLDALDEVFYEQLEANTTGNGSRAGILAAQALVLQAQADSLAVANEFGSLLQRAGSVGLNASTSHDATKYFVSLPQNKLELWFAMEAERFQAPVFRELYSEKRVVVEERRLRVDGSPMGSFQEAFAVKAFNNNYGRPVIGWPDDFERLGRREVANFYRRHYGPSSLTISIVGDVKPSQVRQFAEKYFGGWRDARAAAPAVPAAADQPTAAPPSTEREFQQASLAGPAVLHAFYRPGLGSPDALPLDVISSILSGSRTSRLYRALVQPGRATSASAVSGYPGEKYPGVMLMYANARPGGSLDALSQDLLRQAGQLADAGPAEDELQRVKKRLRVDLLESLASNSNMAGTLASYAALTGDWKRVLSDLDTVDALTTADIRSAAQTLFADSNRFTGLVLPLRQPKMTMDLDLGV